MGRCLHIRLHVSKRSESVHVLQEIFRCPAQLRQWYKRSLQVLGSAEAMVQKKRRSGRSGRSGWASWQQRKQQKEAERKQLIEEAASKLKRKWPKRPRFASLVAACTR